MSDELSGEPCTAYFANCHCKYPADPPHVIHECPEVGCAGQWMGSDPHDPTAVRLPAGSFLAGVFDLPVEVPRELWETEYKRRTRLLGATEVSGVEVDP